MFAWKEILRLSKMLLSLFWILKISLLLTLFSSSDILPITQCFLISGEPMTLCHLVSLWNSGREILFWWHKATNFNRASFQEWISQAQDLCVLLFSYQVYKFINSESWKQVTLLFNSPLPNNPSTWLQSLQLINLHLKTCNYCNLNNSNYNSI